MVGAGIIPVAISGYRTRKHGSGWGVGIISQSMPLVVLVLAIVSGYQRYSLESAVSVAFAVAPYLAAWVFAIDWFRDKYFPPPVTERQVEARRDKLPFGTSSEAVRDQLEREQKAQDDARASGLNGPRPVD